MDYTKVRDVKSPTRANATDAGIDFFVPEGLKVEDFHAKPCDNVSFAWHNDGTLKYINVLRSGRVLIPSGIHVRLRPGTALVLMNKSGVAAKTGLVVGSCVVDETYTGEVHLSMINTSVAGQQIKPGDKIVQGLILNVSNSIPEEFATKEDLYSGFETTRGEGGFGSSGTN